LVTIASAASVSVHFFEKQLFDHLLARLGSGGRFQPAMRSLLTWRPKCLGCKVFLSGATPSSRDSPDDSTAARWQEHYQGALQRFRGAGIETTADAMAGARAYVELRRWWEPFTQMLTAPELSGPMRLKRRLFSKIDTAS
jgi:hypothetical protein